MDKENKPKFNGDSKQTRSFEINNRQTHTFSRQPNVAKALTVSEAQRIQETHKGKDDSKSK